MGSAGFTFSSYVLLAEVTHSYNPFTPPEALSLGYVVATLNLVGSVAFLVASTCYFIRPLPSDEPPPPSTDEWGWEWRVSEWGVRFTFGVGSLCFVLGALASGPEILSEPDPLEATLRVGRLSRADSR